MANIHIDIYNGNDANDGSSWALAKKTLPVPLVEGAIYKFCKSPDPVGTGINATWTNNSATVVTASPLTKSIEQCVGNTWTKISASVTLATYATQRKLGATAQQMTINNTSFTTGKIAYKQLAAPLDLSGFNKISLWANINDKINGNNSIYSVCLCSDTVGDVIVNKLVFDTFLANNCMQAMVLDNGSALGNNINSIAIYQDGDIASYMQLRLSNIFACNDILNLHSLFGQSGDKIGSEWFSPQSIVDSTIIIDSGSRAVDLGFYNYVNGTVTTELFTRKAFSITAEQYYITLPAENTNNFELSFGWDMVSNMQDSYTWFDSLNHDGAILYATGSTRPKYFKVKNLGYTRGTAVYSSNEGVENFENISIINNYCSGSVGVISSTPQNSNVYKTEMKNIFISNCFRASTDNPVLVVACQISNGIRMKCCDAGANSGLYIVIQSSFAEHTNIHVSENRFKEAIQIPAYYQDMPINYNVCKDFKVSNSGTIGLKVYGYYNTFINYDGLETLNDSIQIIGTTYFRRCKKQYLKDPGMSASINFGLQEYCAENDLLKNGSRKKIGLNFVTYDTAIKRLPSSAGSWRYVSLSSFPIDIMNSSCLFDVAEIYCEKNVPAVVGIWVKNEKVADWQRARFIVRKDINDVADNVVVNIPYNTVEWQLVYVMFLPLETGIYTIELRLDTEFNSGVGHSVYIDSVTKG